MDKFPPKIEKICARGPIYVGILLEMKSCEKREPTFCMQAIFGRANLKTREYNAKDICIHVSPQFQKRLHISAVSTESNNKATIFIK